MLQDTLHRMESMFAGTISQNAQEPDSTQPHCNSTLCHHDSMLHCRNNMPRRRKATLPLLSQVPPVLAPSKNAISTAAHA
jgi:hypothetical protein